MFVAEIEPTLMLAFDLAVGCSAEFSSAKRGLYVRFYRS